MAARIRISFMEKKPAGVSGGLGGLGVKVDAGLVVPVAKRLNGIPIRHASRQELHKSRNGLAFVLLVVYDYHESLAVRRRPCGISGFHSNSAELVVSWIGGHGCCCERLTGGIEPPVLILHYRECLAM
jgi:hypothetical protein